MKARLLILALILALLSLVPVEAAGQKVYVANVKGIIDPFVARYVRQAVEAATREGANCLIIELDTPGGTDTAMREIVQTIMNSEVPVVVYVSPPGARAASAGLFITMAAHVAAMAPGTNIGAAHPVGLMEPLTGTLETKITQDAAAYIRAIAQERGRNAEWAEQAVRESASLTAQEALEKKVVDLIAADLPELLRLIDGRKVKVKDREVSIATAGAPIERVRMSWTDDLLHSLVNPDVAYILLSLGILALMAEFYNPGTFIPGITGIICLILAFVALGSLPVNWGGIALIILAIILFLVDLKVTGFALSIGGAIAFVLGSLMLFSPWPTVSPAMPSVRVSWWLIALMTTGFLAFFLFALSAVWRAQRRKALTGLDTVIGAKGWATSDLNPMGTVLVKSEEWTAEAMEPPILKGESIEVVKRDGIRLIVRKSQER
ncbi:MAG: nodulation protein NfeD [Anaerolineae bacterium]|nr:nodulation protein NfeD [Anaerolineae bacterium]MDW8101663.1 nodulation protein NfeD [Anaerolineae bacterium]